MISGTDGKGAGRHSLDLAFLIGTAGAGIPIAVLHVLANPGGPVRDAAILGLVCALFYGGWLAASTAAAALAGRLRRQPGDGLVGGIALFVFLFGCGYFLHGLTYDQLPSGPAAGRWTMAGFVAAIALGVLVAAIAIGWTLARLLRRLASRTATRRIATVLVVVSAVLLPAGLAGRSQGRVAASPPPPANPSPPLPVLPSATEHPPAPNVAFVGLDGADWRVLRPLLDSGQLPHFAGLIAEGVSGPLATIADSNSAVIWASIYSGKLPAEHGVHDFFRVTFPGMRRGFFPLHRVFLKEFADAASKIGLARFRTVSRYDLEVLPLWEVTDRLGVSTGLVDGYLYSFPVSTPTTSGSYAIAYGANEWSAQLARSASGASSRAADVGLFIQPPELFRELRAHLATHDGADFDWQAAVGGQLLRDRPLPRFFSFYTHEPDTVQHLYWKWFEPEKYFGVRATDLLERQDRIAERYRAFDRWLGELRQRLGPDGVIVVASDHGHSPTILHQKFFTQHRHGPPGILIASGGPLRRGLRVDDATIYDVAPTLLWLLGLPVPADLAGRVRTDFIDAARASEFPVRSIPTYEGLWQSTLRAGATKGFEAEELQKLRALGYL